MIDKDNDCEQDESKSHLLRELLLGVDIVTEIEEEKNHKDHMEEVDAAFHFAGMD